MDSVVGTTAAFRPCACWTFHNKNIVSVNSSNGCEHLMCLDDDGHVYSCGYNARGQLGHGTSSKNIAYTSARAVQLPCHQIACSYYHTIVATDQDDVFSFGRNDFGQLGIGSRRDAQSRARSIFPG